jgi:hypothetical protein
VRTTKIVYAFASFRCSLSSVLFFVRTSGVISGQPPNSCSDILRMFAIMGTQQKANNACVNYILNPNYMLILQCEIRQSWDQRFLKLCSRRGVGSSDPTWSAKVVPNIISVHGNQSVSSTGITRIIQTNRQSQIGLQTKT